MKLRRWLLWLIVGLTFGSAYIDLPGNFKIKFTIPGSRVGWRDIQIDREFLRSSINWQLGRFQIVRDLNIKKGIDLAGGTHLVFKAQMDKIPQEDRDSALDAAKENIDRRVNLFGLTEPLVQTSRIGDEYRLIVELPGIEAIDEAIELIGQTAQLDFRELSSEATESATIADYQSTGLTGADLARSQVQFDPNTGAPVVGLKFNSEGSTKFAEITQNNVGKPVGIFLDEMPVTLPRVQEAITSGEAVITGDFTVEQAKRLAIQLNAGALPVPVEIIEQRNVGATLGVESINRSLRAGLIGLTMVVVFMIGYYGYLGFLAVMGLVVYALLTLSIYKLVPVTLTLPGVAGFILSVGMAVDSNILIFERMKEEIRSGSSRLVAMELGFGRAWDSIRDANVCTLITCFILFNPFSWSFLNTSGMVRGFALTLGLGVLLSLFTGIVVTRTLLRTFSRGESKPESEKGGYKRSRLNPIKFFRRKAKTN